MSVRASLKADTVALTELNRHQALSTGRAGTAKSLHASEGTADSSFRDSLQAQFGSMDSEDGPPESVDVSTKTASSSSHLPTAMGTADRADPNHGFAPVTADSAGAAETVTKKQNRSSRAQSVATAAVQKRLSNLSGHKSAVASPARSGKESLLDESADKEVNTRATRSEVIVFSNPAAAIPAPTQNGPIAPDSILSCDSSENSSTALTRSSFQAGTKAPSSPSAGSYATAAHETISDARHGASGEIHSAVAQADEPKTNSAALSDLESGRRLPDQVRSLAFSSINTSPGLQADQAAAQSEASSDLVSATGSDQDTSLEGATRTSDNQVVHASQVSSTSTAENRVAGSRRSENENGGWAQLPSGAAAFESVRDVNRLAQSKVSLRNAMSTNATARTSRLSSSRLSSSGGGAQNLKQVLPSVSDAFTPHSLNVSRITEVTNARITPQKIGGGISSDTRLEETFTALEPGSRNETGAFNWTRTGHVQAEAGYRDPTLGWIGVRAEASGGVVHATLVPQSSDAAQALSGHIAGLHSYLADNRTPVETLTLASFGGNAQQFAGQDSGQGMHHGAGQNAGQDNASEPVLQAQSMTRPITGGALREASITEDGFMRRNAGSGSEGIHISVLA